MGRSLSSERLNRRGLIAKGLAAGAGATLWSGAGTVQAAESRRRRRSFKGAVRNVVLVHGAYADGSSWSEVIARLQRRRGGGRPRCRTR